jgi:hypothetical protein
LANALYPLARQNFLKGLAAYDLSAGTMSCIFVTVAYIPTAAHQYFNPDLTNMVGDGGNLFANAKTIGGIVIDPDALVWATASNGGCFSGNPVTFTAVNGICKAIVIFKNSGVDTTSPLIAYIDTGTGLPFTSSGGGVTITWGVTSGVHIFTI